MYGALKGVMLPCLHSYVGSERKRWAGKVAWWLIAQTALGEVLGSISRSTWQLTPGCDSSSRRSDTSFRPSWTPGMLWSPDVQFRQSTHAHRVKINKPLTCGGEEEEIV